jgi:hypothetical protein
MSNLLSLIMHEETTNKFSELTKRVYRLKKVGGDARVLNIHDCICLLSFFLSQFKEGILVRL